MLSFSVQAATRIWDAEGVKPIDGSPSPRWDNDDNWNTDTEPTVGDTVHLLPGSLLTSHIHLVLQAVEITSIDCKVRFLLDSTLILQAASEFTDAVLPLGEGAIHASSSVTFKGQNDASKVGMLGTGPYKNQGNLLLKGDSIEGEFINSSVTMIISNATLSLWDFKNTASMAIGPGSLLKLVPAGSPGILNSGTISASAGAASRIEGSFRQTAGQIRLDAGSDLAFGAGDQS